MFEIILLLFLLDFILDITFILEFNDFVFEEFCYFEVHEGRKTSTIKV